MKRSLFTLLTVAMLATSASAVSYTETKTFKKNQCSSGYSALKKILKDRARRTCVREAGSSGINILRQERWRKISCTKNKVKGKKTTVTVKGTFSANCK